jgi:hypothetical protein
VFDGRDTYDLEAALRLTDSAWRVAVSLSVPLHDPPQAPTGNAPTSPPVTRVRRRTTPYGERPTEGGQRAVPGGDCVEAEHRLRRRAAGTAPHANQVRLSAEDP